MFAVNDLVVYPAQGVGVVSNIFAQNIGDATVDFYKVSIVDSNVTLMVPIANALNVGLRKLNTLDKCKLALKSLAQREGVTTSGGQNWNRRHREYSDRLKSGKLEDSCHVLRELMLLSSTKELSFGEKRILEQALALVSAEFSYVEDKPKDEIIKDINEVFSDVINSEATI